MFSPRVPFRLMICIVVAIGAACGEMPDKQLYVFDGVTMGTYYRVSIAAAPGLAVEPLKQEIDEVLETINQSMSTYLETSEVSLFNRAAAGEPLRLSEPVASVVKKAMFISGLSGGAFDITVGPLVKLWGFGADGGIEYKPDPLILSKVMAGVGQHHLKLVGRNIEKSHPATEIDLSAIAKGYAIDQIAALLSKHNMHDWLIDVGGELRAAGENIERPWQVAIEAPSVTGGIQSIMELKNQAIATSGDYRNFVMLDGEAYSHAIDPSTGYPVRHSLASVSVLHDSAETADALATALLIMGHDKALALADEENLSVFLINRDSTMGKFKITKTGEFTSTSH